MTCSVHTMSKSNPPKTPGYVCPETGRVAVLVADLAGSSLNGAVSAYFYREEAEDTGLHVWRLVDGIDAHLSGRAFDVCFASGSFRTVGPLMTVFLSAADATRLSTEVLGPPRLDAN